MGRPTVKDWKPLYLRAPGALVDGLDEWVEEIKRATPVGSTATRTTLVRDLLQRALDEHRAGKPAPKT